MYFLLLFVIITTNSGVTTGATHHCCKTHHSGFIKKPRKMQQRRFLSVLRRSLLPQEIHANHGQINWYPGHMARAEREIMETYRKEVDFVVEVRDARLPFSTAADRLADLVGNKPRLILLNKSDLACPEATKDAVNELRKDYDNVFPTSIHSNRSGKSASKIVSKLRDKVPQRFRTLDALVLICGVPNVGKSTVINAIRNVCMRRESRSSTKTRRNNKKWGRGVRMCSIVNSGETNQTHTLP